MHATAFNRCALPLCETPIMTTWFASLLLAGLILTGCSGSPHASPGSASTTTGAGSTYTVPLKECHSGRSLDQVQLDACAGEAADAVGESLSKSLATESTYWGTKVVAAVQSQWARYARAECLTETAGNVGGSAYGMLFTQCATSLMKQRLTTVRGEVEFLRKIEAPVYRSGRFSVTAELTTG